MRSIFLIMTLIFSAAAEQGYYSNENRALFILPREAAMGGADISFSRNANLHSNPASVSLGQGSNLQLSYAGFYDNAFSTSMLSYVTTLPKGAGVGVSAGYLYVPDIAITTSLPLDDEGEPVWDPAFLRYASFSEIAFSVVFGKTFLSRPGADFSAGTRLHGLRRRLPADADSDDIGYGIGLDAGAMACLKKPNIRFSLLLNDITTNYIYWNSSYKDFGVPHAHLGAAWQKEIPYIYGKIEISYKTPDVLTTERIWNLLNSSEKQIETVDEGVPGDAAAAFLYMGHYGFEYVIYNTVAIRTGFNSGKFSFGGGINLFSSALSVDFSYLGYVSTDLEGTYVASVGYAW